MFPSVMYRSRSSEDAIAQLLREAFRFRERWRSEMVPFLLKYGVRSYTVLHEVDSSNSGKLGSNFRSDEPGRVSCPVITPGRGTVKIITMHWWDGKSM